MLDGLSICLCFVSAKLADPIDADFSLVISVLLQFPVSL